MPDYPQDPISDPQGWINLWNDVNNGLPYGRPPGGGSRSTEGRENAPNYLPRMGVFSAGGIGSYNWLSVLITVSFPEWRDKAGRFMKTPEAISQAVMQIAEMYRAQAANYPAQSGLSMQSVYGLHWLQNINYNVPTKKSQGVYRSFGNEIGSGIIASPFKTIRQHRWFFANMPHMPYTRTQQLAMGWHTSSSGPLTVRVTNTVPYAWALHAPVMQSMYAKSSGWLDTSAIRDKYQKDAEKIMKQALDSVLGTS